MKEGPNIAAIAALIGDPARANMLQALMTGVALTASELAQEAGVTPQTSSFHLSRMADAGLVSLRKQGRHKYYSLADADVAALLEAMSGIAMRSGMTRVRTGPREPELRKARVCYNHLAGEYGVQAYDSLIAREFLVEEDEKLVLSSSGRSFFTDLGLVLPSNETKRRPLCKSCLDWSARRSHLAGITGTALLSFFFDQGWAKRVEGSRVIQFSKAGDSRFHEAFSLQN
ncbi:winged helix-turn-helix domain-containing protein [Pseudovibrio sp. Tun.PSC04-5.I4]|uniref:ArsR/SmtB family transcription factor n=1 Tax=Pseudovibrio sp. Tun.PSC04-5.I4 TaxID=1798213 RepID=UPI000885A4E6|nr:winged helix-turn-helix domain-containing protein [Pseudovibrio sp. Tun.PSC04-5.I4]SDQ84075.1 DNA-binding transcriptional regulator, ArsR family [Pseudovibrio sp. Tun.PSC04-5.I4]